MKKFHKEKRLVRAVDLGSNDWIKVGGKFYCVTRVTRHVQSIAVFSRIDSHPFNTFVMYVPDHMQFRVYHLNFAIMKDD